MSETVQSESMTPIESALVWKCRLPNCGYRWLIVDKNKPPRRCAKCKSILWNRGKLKTGPKAKRGPKVKANKAARRKGK